MRLKLGLGFEGSDTEFEKNTRVLIDSMSPITDAKLAIKFNVKYLECTYIESVCYELFFYNRSKWGDSIL